MLPLLGSHVDFIPILYIQSPLPPKIEKYSVLHSRVCRKMLLVAATPLSHPFFCRLGCYAPVFDTFLREQWADLP